MLNHKQLNDIKNLQLTCEQNENIKLKLNWDMLHTRIEKETMDFFYYENDQLIGFMGLYGFGYKVEVCGMVHPEYRRKGIFSKLFSEALQEIKKGTIKQVLLNTPANSISGKGFLQSTPCHFAFSENQMKWSETEIEVEDRIIIRTSTKDDLETEIQLDVKCFGFSEEEARTYNQRVKREGTQHFYIIEVDQQKVGKIRVQRTDDEAWIYGFAIFPAFQGKGYGRKALKKIIKVEFDKGYSIFLEVEATNSHALRLYESCGFKAIDSQHYYQYKGEY